MIKRNIKLITIFKTNNIGAILQAFALKTVLENYGKVALVDIKNNHIDEGIKLIRFGKTFKSILSVGKDILRLSSRKLVIRKFNLFLKKFTIIDLDQINNEVTVRDYFFTGSDQIWNPDCISNNSKIDKRYFFENIESKNINAYASSKGSYNYSKEQESIFLSLISKFNKISVREKDFCDYLIRNKFPFAEHVLDPSLLLSKKSWLNFDFKLDYNIEKKLPQKYILVYTIPRIKILPDLILHVKETLGLPVIIIDQNFKSFKNTDMQLKSAGPEDFINLFNRADFVITDSFHGTCFALNFNKNFITADIGKLSNRVKSLLSLVNLNDRLVNNKEVTKFNTKKSLSINFQESNNILDLERKRCLNYINDCFQ